MRPGRLTFRCHVLHGQLQKGGNILSLELVPLAIRDMDSGHRMSGLTGIDARDPEALPAARELPPEVLGPETVFMGYIFLDARLAAITEQSAVVLHFALHDTILPVKEKTMTAAADRKEYPISMRLPEADVAMIDRAASLRGRSRTDFVREAAVRAAEEVVMENRLIRMSPEGFAELIDILSRPGTPVAEMVELGKRPAPWEPGYSPRR